MIYSDLKVPEKYQTDIKKAIEILKNEGCTEIYLFGSLVKGNYNENSDIDIAIKGLSPDKYFKVLGKLMFSLTNQPDLIDLDEEENSFSRLLKEKGELVRVP